MTNRKSASVRLNENRRQKLQAIKELYDLRSRNEAIRMLIDSFELPGESDIDNDATEGSGADTTSSTAALPATRDTTNESDDISVVISADDDEIFLKDIHLNDLTLTDQSDIASFPGIDPLSSQHNILQTKNARLKAAGLTCRYLCETMGADRRSRREMELVLEHLFDGAGDDTIGEYLDKMVGRGMLFRHPLYDDQIQEKLDDVLRNVYRETNRRNYQAKKNAGTLPREWADLLPKIWEYTTDEYILDRETYLSVLDETLVGVRDEIIDTARNSGAKGGNDARERLFALKYLFRHLANLAASRTYLMSDYQIEPDALSGQTNHAAEQVEKRARELEYGSTNPGMSDEVKELMTGFKAAPVREDADGIEVGDRVTVVNP